MQQEKKNNKTVTILSWFLVLMCMAVIFWLSSRTADESAAQSGVIVEWIIKHFGDNGVTDFMVRKSAHFLRIYRAVLFNQQCNISNKEKNYTPLCLHTDFVICNK